MTFVQINWIGILVNTQDVHVSKKLIESVLVLVSALKTIRDEGGDVM